MYNNNSFHMVEKYHSFDIKQFLLSEKESGSVIIPYIGWLGHNNIGDDIVFDILCNIFRDALNEKERTEIDFISTSVDNKFPSDFDWELADAVVLGGGSTIDPFYIKKLLPALDRNIPAFGFAAGFQKDSDVTEEEEKIISRLVDLKFGSVRGPSTQKTLKGICQEISIPSIVDSGFISPNYYNSQRLTPNQAQFIDSSNQKRKNIVAINSLNLEYAIKPIVHFMEKYINEYNFVIIPFDDSTLEASRKIYSNFVGSSSVFVETNFHDYSVILSWYSNSIFSVNMKLHASVLCSSVGTPAIGYGGGRKIDEYFGSINSSDLQLKNFEIKYLLDKIEEVKLMKTSYNERIRPLSARVFLDHLKSVQQLLNVDKIKSRLKIFENNPMKVTGVQCHDHGFILAGSAKST